MVQIQRRSLPTRQRIAESVVMTAEDQFSVTVSVGVADYAKGDADILPALRRADEALFRAKAGGRNRVCCSTR